MSKPKNTVDIGGLSIQFPFEPYDIQKDFMSKVVACCQNSQNGLLESPTGTGKTLSLLCSSLAWLADVKHKGTVASKKANAKVVKRMPDQEPVAQYQQNMFSDDFPDYKVIYSSRTHKQLSQAMDEMKKTVYKNHLTAVCLGSRDQYCVNEDVRSLPTLTEKNQSCRERTRCPPHSTKSCKFFRRPISGQIRADYTDMIEQMQQISVDDEDVLKRGAVIDIELMAESGISKTGCPYYAAQFAASRHNPEVVADVIFCPYNYIFNKAESISLKDAIIIFDEGHNIENTCEEAGSASISTFTLKQCVSGLKILINNDHPDLQAMRSQRENLIPERLQPICDFSEKLANAITSSSNVSKPPIKWFTNVISSANPGAMEQTSMLSDLTQIVSEISNFFSETLFVLRVDGKNDGTKNFLTAMKALADFLSMIFVTDDLFELHKLMSQSYRVAISEIGPNQKLQQQGNSGWQLDLFCLNPAVAISKLVQSQVRSIIITSGTLAPLTSFEAELGIVFDHKLSNPHVIQKDQLMIFPVDKYGDCVLDGSYRASNNNDNYYRNLGLAIATYVKTIPKGVLIFFKSYSALNTSMSSWQNSGILKQIESSKKIFQEPRNMRDFTPVLDSYKDYVNSGKGAILVAVYRGKISEGLDLADDYCRSVIVIGLPYPAWTDPHVQLKREYLDGKKDVRLTKDRWYATQMLRAVNQAIGRIIRHRNDYGVVLLIDSAYKFHLKELSAWLQDFVMPSDDFKSQTFADFFRSNATRKRSQKAFPIFASKPVKRIESPAVLTDPWKEETSGDRKPLDAKRVKVNVPERTIPIRPEQFLQVDTFMKDNWNDLKQLLQHEKVSQLLTIMKDMKEKGDVRKFTAGIQRTFFGLPRNKIDKHVRDICILVKLSPSDRRDLLRKLGISDS